MSKIKSRPATPAYRDNYDRLFRDAKDARKKRAEERQIPVNLLVDPAFHK